MGYVQRVQTAARKVKSATQSSGFDDRDKSGLADSLADQMQDPLAMVGENDYDRNTRRHAAAEDAITTLSKQIKVGFAKSGDLASFAMKMKEAGDAAAEENPAANAACDMLVAWMLDLDGLPPVSAKGVGSSAKKATQRGVGANLQRLGHVVFGGKNPADVATGSMAKAWDASFDAARLQSDARKEAEATIANWPGVADVPTIYEAFRKANVPIADADLRSLAVSWLMRDVYKKAEAGNSMVEAALMAHEGNRTTDGERGKHTSRGLMRSGRDEDAMPEIATQVEKIADLVADGDFKGARSVAETVKSAVKHRKADHLRKPMSAVVDALKSKDAASATQALTQLNGLLQPG